MSNKAFLGNIFNDCGILFFILVFLLLFWGNGSKGTVTNEM